tara:strand:- start:4904 stop:5908 length:1005 start_codon:yes stop_codon:yes gene_type:complete
MFKKLKKTMLIAEACENHFGKLSNAKKMIREAKKSGADYVKFQHHIPEEEMLKKVPKSKNFNISLYNFLKKNSLKIYDHEILKNYCKVIGIKYLCTPFCLKAAHELNEIGVDMFKIGSGEFTDLPFINGVLKLKKPVIFSTGMTTPKEMIKIYKFIKSRNRSEFAFLNCTSEYPPRYEDLNLNYIKKMISNFKGTVIGHSDHTNDIYSSLAAVTLGAKIVEKHVNLDNLNYGPDRHVSISFKKFKEMANAIRIIEKSLGSNKKIYNNEIQIVKWARRSIVSIKNINKGEKLTEKNIFSKRPSLGIPSYEYFKILGKKAKKSIKENTLIKKIDIN